MFELQNPARRAAQLETAILFHLRHRPHTTVDELLNELRGEPGLTRATVHNLLEDLTREGKLRKLPLLHGEAYCLSEKPYGYPFSTCMIPLA